MKGIVFQPTIFPQGRFTCPGEFGGKEKGRGGKLLARSLTQEKTQERRGRSVDNFSFRMSLSPSLSIQLLLLPPVTQNYESTPVSI